MIKQSRHSVSRTPIYQQGLSLVELMIAVTLGIVITAGIIQIYTSNKTTYSMQDDLAHLQENARFALEFISRDIRMADSMGCINTGEANINNLITASHGTFTPTIGIAGWEAAGTGPGPSIALPNLFNTATMAGTDISASADWNGWTNGGVNPLPLLSVIPGSDIIRVWHTANISQPVTTIAGTTVTLNALGNIAQGDAVLLTDCDRTDLILACNTNAADNSIDIVNGCPLGGASNNTSGNFLTVNAAGASVSVVTSSIYFIGKSGGQTAAPPALFRTPLSATPATATAPGIPVEIAQGVENMQIIYGVDDDSNNVPDRFVPASPAIDWTTVVSVKISLLMATATNVGANNNPIVHNLNGALITSNGDSRLRRVYSTTIALRSRV